MILHLSHIFLTDGLTFIICSLIRFNGKAAETTLTLSSPQRRAHAQINRALLLLNTFQRQSRRNYANAEFSSAEGSRADKPRSFADLVSLHRYADSVSGLTSSRPGRYGSDDFAAAHSSQKNRSICPAGQTYGQKPKESDRRKFEA